MGVEFASPTRLKQLVKKFLKLKMGVKLCKIGPEYFYLNFVSKCLKGRLLEGIFCFFSNWGVWALALQGPMPHTHVHML